MEDYFGFNRFGDPRKAFHAYYHAFKDDERPEGAEIHYDLGLAMMTYFMEWYPKHNETMEFETLWLTENGMPVPPNTPDARPCVEETFTLDLGIKVIVDKKTGNIIAPYVQIRKSINIFNDLDGGFIYQYHTPEGKIKDVDVVPICYHGTFDRIVVDKYGRWWITDYKTAKGADTNKLDTDDQISAYMWAAEQWYQHPIYGFIYLQMTKETPKLPRRLKNGALSVDKKQHTTYQLFKTEVLKDYGEVRKAPNAIIEMLNHLAELDTPEGDRFIRWDFVTRNNAQKISTYNHIMGEVKLMLDPSLYLFPNPTRDCIWDCPFRDICIALDSGREDEAKFMLDQDYEKRPRVEDGEEPEWRSRIQWPDENAQNSIPIELIIPDNIFNIELPPEYQDKEED
jgi:hypothetical protein